jgi:hypothetical protein
MTNQATHNTVPNSAMAITQKLVNGDFVIVKINASKWTGKKQLEGGDIKAEFKDTDTSKEAVVKVPPKDLVSLGRKCVFDKQRIKEFDDDRTELVGIARSIGSALPEISATAFSMPLAEYQSVFKPAADEIAIRYAQRADKLVEDYDEVVEKFIQQNSEWEDMIRKAIEPKESIRNKFSFTHRVFKIGLIDEDILSPMNNDTHAISQSLFDDFVNRVKQIMVLKVKSYQNKEKINQKTMPSVKEALSILRNMLGIDDCVKPSVNLLEHVIDRMPKSGYIDHEHFALLKATCEFFSSYDNIINTNNAVASFNLDKYLNPAQKSQANLDIPSTEANSSKVAQMPDTQAEDAAPQQPQQAIQSWRI